MITFNPLWRTLDIKGISTYRLEHQYGMSKSMIHKLKHNQSITLQTLNQLCAMLDCNITDIIPTHFDYFSEIKNARKSTENQGFLQTAPT